MVSGAASNQVGAGIGAHAFPALGVPGVVAVRQLVAAAVLLPMARPPVRRMTWAQWWPVLLLALVFAVMNLSLYTAIDRIGLGLAVTLEFLGPLAVALAGSRSRRDLLMAAAGGRRRLRAGAARPQQRLRGARLGLVAAGCWAAYIVLNRVAGRVSPASRRPRWPPGCRRWPTCRSWRSSPRRAGSPECRCCTRWRPACWPPSCRTRST